MAPELTIRSASSADDAGIWEVLEPMLRAGDTYALPRDMSQADALSYWHAPSNSVFVAEYDGRVVGTYILRANQQGGGAHVANCGYVSHPDYRGRGIARAMCAHSLEEAQARGFLAMQFNFVVSTNEGAVRLWQRMGFAVVGRLPGAFQHPALGDVDALVLYRDLSDVIPSTQCDECGSLFRRAVSPMRSLCPECAHRLYGYEPCAHEMVNGHCARCYWDGSASEYLRTR